MAGVQWARQLSVWSGDISTKISINNKCSYLIISQAVRTRIAYGVILCDSD